LSIIDSLELASTFEVSSNTDGSDGDVVVDDAGEVVGAESGWEEIGAEETCGDGLYEDLWTDLGFEKFPNNADALFALTEGAIISRENLDTYYCFPDGEDGGSSSRRGVMPNVFSSSSSAEAIVVEASVSHGQSSSSAETIDSFVEVSSSQGQSSMPTALVFVANAVAMAFAFLG